MAIRSTNPFTGELIKEFPTLSELEIQQKIAYARKKQYVWREFNFSQRAHFLNLLAGYFERRKDELARLMSLEMGKLLPEGIAEIEKCAWVCRYYAENTEKFLAKEVVETDADESYITYEPLGVILGVMPWNFPFWQVMRFAAPTLMAGNVVLLKHASNVPQCSLAIERAFQELKFPDGVFQSLLIGSEQVESVISNPAVKGVSLTGSEAAGRSVAEIAGSYLKKSLLELGGSDPAIVLADADLDRTVKGCVSSRFKNAGQSCIAAKRFIVHESIYDQFVDQFSQAIERFAYANPTSTVATIAPLATRETRDRLEKQVNDSIKLGARLMTGGSRYDGDGFGYMPTLLADVTTDMPVFNEETFGPVAAVIKFKDIDDAIALANCTKYGLGASIWTQDIAAARRIVPQLSCGFITINNPVTSDPRLPFGGVNNSGYGRELSRHGVVEFTNVKSVCIST